MNNKKMEKQLKKKNLYETAVREKKLEVSEEKWNQMKNRISEKRSEQLEKQRKLNSEFKKKDYIKNELFSKLESDKMTLREINKLK